MPIIAPIVLCLIYCTDFIVHVVFLTAYSPRDDLISLGFSLVHLGRYSLPWEDASKDKILQMMKEASISDICRDLPGNIYPYNITIL